MTSPKNIPATRALIDRYRAITLDDIEKAVTAVKEYADTFTYGDVAYELTGFGTPGSCALCEALYDTKHWRGGPRCESCLHFEPGCGVRRGLWGVYNMPCAFSDNSKPTYNAIESASSPEELLSAFRARADYLEKLVSLANSDGKKES